ncbi:hypothetical protein D3C85_1791320 [compost metagenome]
MHGRQRAVEQPRHGRVIGTEGVARVLQHVAQRFTDRCVQHRGDLDVDQLIQRLALLQRWPGAGQGVAVLSDPGGYRRRWLGQ